jgi:hypothetical protein
MPTGEREQTIARAYAAFRAVRRLPADKVVVEVVNLILQARGMKVMSGDERRIVDAHVSCTWDQWQVAATTKTEPSGCDAFDQLPDALATTTTTTTAAADGCRGRATLWD